MTAESLNQIQLALDKLGIVTQHLRDAHRDTTHVEGLAIRPAILASYELRKLIDEVVSAAKCDGDNAPKPAVSTCMNCGGETLGSTVNVCRSCVDAVTMRKDDQ